VTRIRKQPGPGSNTGLHATGTRTLALRRYDPCLLLSADDAAHLARGWRTISTSGLPRYQDDGAEEADQ
jgi:hypothetical protein